MDCGDSFHPDVREYASETKELPFFTNHKDASTPRFLQSSYRFNITYKHMNPYLKPTVRWMDFGPYPGHIQQFIQERTGIRCRMAGLGFDADFKKHFGGYEFYPMDFEKPVTGQAHTKIKESNDLVTSFNTIEHLLHPNRMLDLMNYYSKKGGIAIITTDNISHFWGTMSMLVKGGSPLDHPIKSNVFYTGVWRPHIRLYSRSELAFLLNHSGFKVIHHHYFDHRSNEYANRKLKRKPGNLIRIAGDIVKSAVPHMKNHQLIIAKKVVKYDDLDKMRPIPTADERIKHEYESTWKSYPVFAKTR